MATKHHAAVARIGHAASPPRTIVANHPFALRDIDADVGVRPTEDAGLQEGDALGMRWPDRCVSAQSIHPRDLYGDPRECQPLQEV